MIDPADYERLQNAYQEALERYAMIAQGIAHVANLGGEVPDSATRALRTAHRLLLNIHVQMLRFRADYIEQHMRDIHGASDGGLFDGTRVPDFLPEDL